VVKVWTLALAQAAPELAPAAQAAGVVEAVAAVAQHPGH
jgi:hypothetical protein